jgi:hypothetical protein
MSNELFDVLEDIRSLAEQREWVPVASLANELLSAESTSTILVASPEGVDASAFKKWLLEVAPNDDAVIAPLEDLVNDPLPTLKSDRVVALFDCGQLMGAGAVEAINNAFFTRPPASYAIVLGGAEQLETDEDLNLISRNAWRLLVPEPKPDWDRQDLLEQQCFLWGADPLQGIVAGRIEHDREALQTWLQSRQEHSEEMTRQRAIYLIDFVDENISRRRRSEPDTDVDRQQIVNARETLSEVRRRLTRRLDADASSSERQLTASLQTLGNHLLDGLRPYLQQHLPSASAYFEPELQRVLADYIRVGSARWQHDMGEVLSQRGRDILSDTEALLRSVDWDLINDVVSKSGKPQTYPESLLEDTAFGPGGISLNEGRAQKSNASSSGQNEAFATAVKAAGAGALLTASWAVFGLMPAGVVAVILGAIVVVRHRRHNLDKCEAYGQSVIRGVIRAAVSNAREQTHHALAPLRESLFGGLRELENVLEDVLNKERSNEPVVSSSDRVALNEYRYKVASAGSGSH